MEVVVYVEGGGDLVSQRRVLRQGFDQLFSAWRNRAPLMGYSLRFVCCGMREQAYEDFRAALQAYPGRINALLVDAEAPLAGTTARHRAAHLEQQDRWDLSGIEFECVHLMVQCMEAWIVADPDALAEFYGQGFARRSLPVRPNLEEEPKADLLDKLARAIRNTNKAEYDKIRHGSQLLQRIDAAKVAARCPCFATFTDWLTQSFEAA